MAPTGGSLSDLTDVLERLAKSSNRFSESSIKNLEKIAKVCEDSTKNLETAKAGTVKLEIAKDIEICKLEIFLELLLAEESICLVGIGIGVLLFCAGIAGWLFWK